MSGTHSRGTTPGMGEVELSLEQKSRTTQEARAENLSVWAIHEDSVPSWVFEHGTDAAIADLGTPLEG